MASESAMAQLGAPMNIQMRSLLMRSIAKKVMAWACTQAEAAKQLGMTQARASCLLNGHIEAFSLDALVNIANSIGIEFEISLKD